MPAKRVDAAGRAYKGSQLQTQIYVNRRRDELERAVMEGLPSLAVQQPALKWVSPIEVDSFKEYHDVRFLNAVGLKTLAPLLREFWPARGPHWDALALVQRPMREPGVLLLEAKGYPGELESGGTRASSTSKERIERALQATQNWLTIPEPNRAAWTGRYYQTANRLAHLYWLRQVAGIDAWMVHLLVRNDPTYNKTSGAQWTRALATMEQKLGLSAGFVPHFGHAYVDGLKRDVL
jgi:hypothetical protein